MFEGPSRLARTGNMLIRASLVLAAFSLVEKALQYASYDAPTEMVVKNQKGEVVTQTTLTGLEIEDVMREIRRETGLTEEQLPKVIDFAFWQLKDAIPKAMNQTRQDIGCAQGI